jgi:AMP-binding enzyme family protein
MLGYYKNEEATNAAIDSDGWFHTGDLGTIDAEGNIFIKGRSKNMLLGSNGQNIYPEEIEDKLNSMSLVCESLVIQEGNSLVGLVYPDYEEAQAMGLNDNDLVNVMEENRKELNASQPAYCHLSEMRIRKEEFEKTPKRSIKRFLYTS